MYAIIAPVAVFPSSATVLFISSVSVQPGASASYQWWLQDYEHFPLTQGLASLSGASYDAWGASDEYLYTYTAGVLGLSIVEIVTEPVPAPVVQAVADTPTSPPSL